MITNYDEIRAELHDLVSRGEYGDIDHVEIDQLLDDLDDAVSDRDDLVEEQDRASEKMIAALSYEPQNERVDIVASGAEVGLSAGLVDMASIESREIVSDIVNYPVNALFDADMDNPVRVTLRLDPIEPTELHNHYEDE